MLADLINFATEGATAARWTLANMDLHRRSADAVQVQKNKTLQIYPVDPIFPGDWESWLQNHQQMHNDLNATLGISGNDFSQLDLNNKIAVDNWVQLHFEEHRQQAAALNIQG